MQLFEILCDLFFFAAYVRNGSSFPEPLPPEEERRGLAAAMADAHEKGSVLAEASGVELGEVIGVVEQPYDESKLIGVDFESSSIVVSADVIVTYLIE